jgi:ABC-type bacteriocin/lantibiotic exporter with double-glycine peptidase domain
MVDQDIFLFEGNVMDNISMWNSAILEERIVAAAKAAVIHEDIATRPDAYKSHVEENGSNFSGGQRQRLEIARALASHPTILIMDEATSALDTMTEQLIDENIRRLGCSCIIIAHRLSTIRDADHIIVLDRGKVVQQGTHDELTEIKGEYATLTQSY